MMNSNKCEDFKNLLDGNKIVIWTTPRCRPCDRIKQMLEENQYEFKEQSTKEFKPQLYECLLKSTNQNGFPQVFVNNTYIGGWDETRELINSGQLREMVQAGFKV